MIKIYEVPIKSSASNSGYTVGTSVNWNGLKDQ